MVLWQVDEWIDLDDARQELTFLALPHIPQDLDMTCDLLLGPLDAIPGEIINQKLVAPPTATS